jgi:aminopeptidase N
VAGRYTRERRTVGGTSVELWHHPTHHENVARVLDAATLSLQQLVSRFGPYPHRTLRLVELPTGWGFGAVAMPGTLLLTEDRGLRLDARYEGVDLLRRRIGHEVAHQWWGGVVTPADVEGAALLVEGLAKYAEQRVVAEVHGEDALPAMLAFDHDRYLAGRAYAGDAEPSLAAAPYTDDYLFYGKAAIAANALHAQLGDAAMTRALRRVLATEGGAFGAATSSTLRQALDAEAHSAHDSLLIAEWMEGRAVYDLRIDSTTLTWRGDSVTVSVTGRVTRDADDRGVSNLNIEVALRAASSSESTPIRTERVPTRTDAAGRFEVRVTRSVAPATVEVDPRYLWIDRNRSNNTKVIGGR